MGRPRKPSTQLREAIADQDPISAAYALLSAAIPHIDQDMPDVPTWSVKLITSLIELRQKEIINGIHRPPEQARNLTAIADWIAK